MDPDVGGQVAVPDRDFRGGLDLHTTEVRLLLLLTFACTLCAASATEFSGVIEMANTVSGLEVDSKDQDEFIRYSALVDARLKQVQLQLLTAPPMVATTLREDRSFYNAELERIAAATGREIVLSMSNYHISRGRAVMSTPPLLRLRVDRNRGTAQAMQLDGKIQDVTLAPLPQLDELSPDNGPLMLGMQTRRYARTFGGKNYTILIAPELPNVCAMTLVGDLTDDELTVGIAKLPGLPMQVETRDGNIVRRLSVTRIAPKPLADEEFAPWK